MASRSHSSHLNERLWAVGSIVAGVSKTPLFVLSFSLWHAVVRKNNGDAALRWLQLARLWAFTALVLLPFSHIRLGTDQWHG